MEKARILCKLLCPELAYILKADPDLAGGNTLGLEKNNLNS